MSRQLIAIAVAGLASLGLEAAASAQPSPDAAPPASASPDPDQAPLFAPAPPPPEASRPAASASAPQDLRDDALGDQAISAAVGLANGGRITPGGLRIVGHYLYQLSGRDWFDGAAAFTFGSGSAACFRDRQDMVICDHGFADGAGVEITARIRRLLAPRNLFHPFATAGVGVGVARFGDDDVTGMTVPLHVGGGLRVNVAPAVALVFEDELALGFGRFGRGLGFEPQLSFTVTLGAEFRLR